MHPFEQLLATFPADNHARGKQFEVLCKWILENDPTYTNKLEEVWLWDDWPEKWGPDLGIDLVAKDTEGKIWAIQAKCYAPENSITKEDINSFLAESSVPQIDVRLLMGTTDRVAKNATATMHRAHELKPVQRMLLSDLLDRPLEWPSSMSDLASGGHAEKFSPKPYQEAAIGDVVAGFEKQDRGQLIMACGTGKTLTGLWIAERLQAEITLVLFPSLLLLSKTLADWQRHSSGPFLYLPVCSDDSVAKPSDDAINFISSDLAFPATTDADEIASFIRQPGRKVIFSTYQSSPQIAEAYRKANLKPLDLVIADEAHRCAGKAGAEYTTVLDDDKVPALKRLFMTATPKIFQSFIKKKAENSGIEVNSMDDKHLFGTVLHKLSFGEAIEQELLTDYQVAIVGVDEPLYREMISDRDFVRTENDIETDAQSLASHIGLAKAIKNYDLRRVISFHSKVKSANEFQKDFREVVDWIPAKSRPDGEFVTNYVSGAMSTSERNRNLRRLGDLKTGERAILSNARCLSEGVDVPALDGVAFIDPRNSEIDIVQAVGRAIRLSSDKSIGTIIIPVFIEEHEDPDEVLSSSAFKRVWSVINALRAHDDELGNQLDALRRGLGKRKSVSRPVKIIFDLPTLISKDFENQLNVKLVESTTASWEFWFGLLEKYKETRGNCIVPSDLKVDSFALGRWAVKQRSYENQNKLPPIRKERLQKIGFIWDTRRNLWEIGYSVLASYKKENGSTLVPAKCEYEGIQLGRWVNTQRIKKKNNKLSTDKIKRLNALKFVWDANLHAWETGFNYLKMYRDEYGDCDVPDNKIFQGFKLGLWVGIQRRQASLTQTKRNRLDSLGFNWDPLNANWELGLSHLAAFKKKHNHCFVPADYLVDGFNLGSWTSAQRSNKGKLSRERLSRLEAQGMVWDVRAARWDQGFAYLSQYKEEHGHLSVKQKESFHGFPLGNWASRQRDKRNELSAEKRKKLETLGFLLNPLNDRWEVAFKYLKAYKKEHKDLAVPAAYRVDNFRLGAWVNQQRTRKKNGTLKLERIKRLDSIGFIWVVRE